MVKASFESNKVVQYARWVVKNKFKVIGLSILAAFALGSGARHLVFSNNYRVFFGEDNPQLLAFDEVENTYTKNDNLMFILTPKDGTVFTPQTLTAVKDLTKRSWKIPYSIRVDSLTNFQHTKVVGDDLFVDDLVKGDPSQLNQSQLEDIRNIALSEPILKDLLITEKSNITGVNVSIQLPQKDPNEVIQVVAYARNLAKEFEQKYPQIETRISGVVALNHAFAENGQNDAATLTPIMYLVMIIIMTLLLRSVGAVIASLGVIVLSTVSAMGFAGYFGVQLTPPSAIAPTVILTLAIADSVHILITMLLLMRKGWEKSEALVESLRVNMQAVFLTSITTIVGFLCLNFSDTPPFHDLGNITAFGVAAAFVFSVSILPALIVALPVKVTQGEVAATRIFERIGNLVVSKYRSILVVGSLAAVALASFIPQIDLNDQFVRWFDERVDFRRDADYLQKNLTGIYNFQYSIPSGEEEGISDPKYMRKIEEFANWWRAQPETIHVATYTDIMKKLNKTMHSDQETWYRIPNDLDLAAQYLLLYEMSLPFGLDLNNQIDINKSSTKMVVTLRELTSTEGREVSTRGDQWLKENAPEIMHAAATGPAVMFSYISERNIRSMIKGTAIALVLITILMIISLKSVRFGLISLLPNAVPIVMSFGLWSITYNQVGMAISIVASATLGIIVDDTVHFITKYLRSMRENGSSTQDAVRYAFSNVGLAIVITSIILIIGFGVLSYSAFLLNWSLGMLSAMTIAIALIVDFTLLPAFLIFVGRCGSAESKTKNEITERPAHGSVA